MSGTFPSPIGARSFEEWASQAADQLDAFAYVPRPAAADWVSWAMALAAAPPLTRYGFPGPAGYGAWQDWAIACRRVYPGG